MKTELFIAFHIDIIEKTPEFLQAKEKNHKFIFSAVNTFEPSLYLFAASLMRLAHRLLGKAPGLKKY